MYEYITIGFFIGLIIGFLISILVLDQFYKTVLKKGIDTIHESYINKIHKQNKEIQRLENKIQRLK